MAEAYCVKDKKKVEVENPQQITMKNGKPALQGTCPSLRRQGLQDRRLTPTFATRSPTTLAGNGGGRSMSGPSRAIRLPTRGDGTAASQPVRILRLPGRRRRIERLSGLRRRSTRRSALMHAAFDDPVRRPPPAAAARRPAP